MVVCCCGSECVISCTLRFNHDSLLHDAVMHKFSSNCPISIRLHIMIMMYHSCRLNSIIIDGL